ncbi:MAG: glycoside hydrolase 43 family protein [Bacteroidaceae bacterium]|nr:glycoside hydrolase 43 family protein [Bacteroidaceae bacterium]
MMRQLFLFATVMLSAMVCANDYVSEVWCADLGNGQYQNPILCADYSDPDVCRVGDDYYMTSSSFNCVPGLQILHSRDLVNWSIIGAALPWGNVPDEKYATVQHGCGVWAPCIRHHNGEFYIFWGDPDVGIFMTHTADVSGVWSVPVLVKAGKGYIDTTPLWDDDGRVYLAHGIAGSRGGLKSVLFVCELSADATYAITESRIVYDGHEKHVTIEGPKFYKRNGYYYIFAPAGGVPTGWQVVLRSKSPYGPYEEQTVMAQGGTDINGPHQGGWVDTPSGEDWFIHFQDVGVYGRLVHLQPLTWRNDGWPVIGHDPDGDGCGEPVTRYRKPRVDGYCPMATPVESDEFDSATLGLQWQWHANYDHRWHYCDASNGRLRLYSYPVPEDYDNLYDVSNLLLQKTPAKDFVVTTRLTFNPIAKYHGERAGLLVMGLDYAAMVLENTPEGIVLSQVQCNKADKGTSEKVMASLPLSCPTIYLRATFHDTGEKVLKSEGSADMIVEVRFYYSEDGIDYKPLGTTFTPREGKWIGAKVGLFCTRPAVKSNDGGWVDVDWWRVARE